MERPDEELDSQIARRDLDPSGPVAARAQALAVVMDPSTFILIVLGVYAVLVDVLPLFIGDSNVGQSEHQRRASDGN